MPVIDDIVVRFGADTSEFRARLEEAGRAATDFSGLLSGGLDAAIMRGRGLSDVLRTIALDLSRQSLRAAFAPIESSLSSGLNSVLGGFGGAVKGLIGGILPFAHGGVVGEPTLFPLGAGRLGLAGEAGPEAILPLARGSDGRLGVAAGGQGGTTNITLNVTARDADSFRRSQPQIEAMLARAVARGQRNL